MYCDYLPPFNIILLALADSTDVSNIISLNLDKSDGPNSIPTRFSKLLNKDISGQLTFFLTNIFPLVYSFSIENQQNYSNIQKRSKLDWSNYRPISPLSNIDKILKDLHITDFMILLKNNNSYILSNLVFDRNIQLLMFLFI